MNHTLYKFVILLLILFLKPRHIVPSATESLASSSCESGGVVQKGEKDLKTKRVCSPTDSEGIFSTWKQNLADLKTLQMYSYALSVEAIGNAVVKKIKKWVQTDSTAKNLIKSLDKEGLKKKLKKVFPPCSSGVPDDFWDNVLDFEEPQNNKEFLSAVNGRLNAWIAKWKEVMDQRLPSLKKLRHPFGFPLIWKLEDIEMMKRSTITPQALQNDFNIVTAQLGYTKTTEIDIPCMLQVFQRSKEKCPGVPESILEVLVVLPIDADEFFLFERYVLRVEMNIKALKIAMEPGKICTGSILNTWLSNAEDFELETGINTKIGWANAALKEIEQIPKKLEFELKEDFITFEAMKSIVKSFIAYGNSRPFKIPKELFLQILYIRGLEKPICRANYLEEVSRRLRFWKDHWIQYGKNVDETQLVLEFYQPSEIYYLNKGDFLEDMNLLKDPQSKGACASVFLLTQKGTTTRAQKPVALKLFEKNTYANEIYLNHILFHHLEEYKNTKYKRYFVPILGRANGIQNFMELCTFSYGLIFECVPLTLRSFCSQFSPSSMPPQLIRAIMCQLLETIGFLNTHGIIHLDIKPNNILIEGDTSAQPATSLSPQKLFEFYMKMITVKIIDFGNACYYHSKYPSFKWPTKVSGTDYVTAEYRAPEIFMGIDTVTPQVDIFSAGLIFYELTTRVPYLKSIWDKFGKKREHMLLYGLLPIAMGKGFTDKFPPSEAFGKRGFRNYEGYRLDHQGFLREIETQGLKPLYDIDGEQIRNFQRTWNKYGSKWAYRLLQGLLTLDLSLRWSSSKALASPFFRKH